MNFIVLLSSLLSLGALGAGTLPDGSPVPAGREYASLETVRFARVVDPATNEVYTLAVIGRQYLFHENDPRRGGSFPYVRGEQSGVSSTEPNFGYLSAHIRKQAMEWDIKRYQEEYPHIDPAFFRRMLALDPGTDEASALVVLFRGNDATDVVSTLRVAMPDVASGKVPLDTLHGRRITPEFKGWKDAPSQRLDFKSGEIKSSGIVKGGLGAELKNLVKDPTLGHEVVPLMLATAERWGLTHPNVLMDEQPWMRSIGDRVGTVSEYWLVCDERMKNFYLRFGFEIVEENVDGSDIVMKIPREKYVAKLKSIWDTAGLQSARGLPGSKLVVDYEHFQSLYDEFGPYGASHGDPAKLLARFGLSFDMKSCAQLFKPFAAQ